MRRHDENAAYLKAKQVIMGPHAGSDRLARSLRSTHGRARDGHGTATRPPESGSPDVIVWFSHVSGDRPLAVLAR
jgi:hypothetical protein